MTPVQGAGEVEALLTRAGAPKQLRDGLMQSFQALRGAQRASLHAQARSAGGEFAEWAARLADWGVTRRPVDLSQPLPPDHLQRLANLRETKSFARPDLQRFAQLLGTMQSLAKPRAAAGTGAAPDAQDAAFLAATAGWILAELARLLGEPDAARAGLLGALAVPEAPLTWDRHGQRLVRAPGLKLQDRVLVVLYFRGKAALQDLHAALPEVAPLAITGVATRPGTYTYYRRADGTVEITQMGREYVEDAVLPLLARGAPPQRPPRGPR